MPRRDQIEAMLKDDPDDTFLNYALAKELVSEGDVGAGIAAFDRVLGLNSDYVPAYFQKAQALSGEGETEAARDVLIRGIEVAQRVGDSHAAGEMTAFLDTL
jgi:tetratricopeptide (TPR) repeat protein